MTSDKSVSVEDRLNALVNQLGTGSIPNVDGNSYGVGPMILRTGSTQVVNGATATTCTGLLVNVAAQKYFLEAHVPFVADSSTPSAYVVFSNGGSLAVSSFRARIIYLGTNEPVVVRDQNDITSNTGLNSAVLTATHLYVAWIRARTTVTTPGDIHVSVAASGSVSPDAYTIQSGAELRLWPDIWN